MPELGKKTNPDQYMYCRYCNKFVVAEGGNMRHDCGKELIAWNP